MMSRVDYKILKQWFLDDAYIWCQRGLKKELLRNGRMGLMSGGH